MWATPSLILQQTTIIEVIRPLTADEGNARKGGLRADRCSLRSTMDVLEDQTIVRVDQVCMLLRFFLNESLHFILVRLGGKRGVEGIEWEGAA